MTRAWMAAVLMAASAPMTDDVGPKAVAARATVDACVAKAEPAQAKDCVLAALRTSQPEAARFMERLNGEGVLKELTETGRVDVAYVEYIYRGNATSGTLLVNGAPAIVDVNAPEHYKKIDIKKEPAYAALAKAGGDVELWADDPSRPFAESTPDGGTRFTFQLAVKTCRACTRVGTGVVAFDFDKTGAFVGTRLLELRAGGDKPPQS
jgi:hypothetical protein